MSTIKHKDRPGAPPMRTPMRQLFIHRLGLVDNATSGVQQMRVVMVIERARRYLDEESKRAKAQPAKAVVSA